MSFDLGKLFIEWRRIVPNGVPNPGNAYHLVLLKEICMAKGIDKDIIDNVIVRLEEQDSETKKDSLSLSGKFLQKVQDILRKN